MYNPRKDEDPDAEGYRAGSPIAWACRWYIVILTLELIDMYADACKHGHTLLVLDFVCASGACSQSFDICN